MDEVSQAIALKSRMWLWEDNRSSKLLDFLHTTMEDHVPPMNVLFSALVRLP